MTNIKNIPDYLRHPRKILKKIEEKRLSKIEEKRRSEEAEKRLREIRVASIEALALPSSASPQDYKTVVSLTSYGSRIKSVHLAIRSAMLQTRKPDLVVLYLDEGSNEVELPNELLELTQIGLIVRRGVPNLRAHTKYYYAMKDYPNSDIITIDDDVIYPETLIDSLYASSKGNEKCVIARRVHKMLFDDAGRLMPYVTWDMEWTERDPHPRHTLMATGVGGVLYPKGCFGEVAFDVDLIKRLSFGNDDLWLKIMEVYHDIPVVYAPNELIHPFTIEGTQDVCLTNTNVFAGDNDRQLALLFDHFGLTQKNFTDE